jgi:hypothetical protein
MAENRGGMRPTAPQNNPANVSGTGGAGQSGRIAQGFAYGVNKEINEQAAGAKLAKTPKTPRSTPMPPRVMSPITPVTAESMLPNQLVTDMSGLSSLPQAPADPDIEQIRTVMPVLEYWASQPDSSQGTKDYVQYLRTII